MILFVVFSVLIFLLWAHFFPPPPVPQNPAPAPVAPAQSSVAPGLPAAAGGIAASASSASVPIVEASSEKIVTVESPVYRVELSTRGAVVRSWKLEKYLDDQKPPRPLDLVNQDAAQELGWPFSLMLSDPQLEARANTAALYQMEAAQPGTLLSAPVEIAFHWSDGHLSITKKLNFTQDYDMTAEVEASLDGKPIPAAIAWRGGFGDKTVYKAPQLVTVFYQQNGKLNLLNYRKLGMPGNQIQPAEQRGPLDLAGIEDQFFAAAFLPAGTEFSLWDWTQWHHYVSGGQNAGDPVAEMAVGTDAAGPLHVRLFVGPKDLAILSRQKPSLEALIKFGWTGIIAKPLLFALQWLHKYIPNFGWAIVIFTLALTMVLFPIRMWTFRSAKKMQAVAPEIQSIQNRYKKYSMSDPRKRKMQEEIMAVYQREGINPIGSCLPMLVQIPFFVAFYSMLGGAIELRHAPWILWIHDLSAKDPYYVLPISMAITMYFSTKMTPMPATADPAQQKMMAFMPLMMGFLFLNFSSGLNLYYCTSNFVNIAQQWYLNRTHPLPSRSKFKKKKE